MAKLYPPQLEGSLPAFINTYDIDEKPRQFEVDFDSGVHKTFKFHIAFASGMEIIQ